MRILFAWLAIAALVSGCGYAHVNRDRSDRPDTSMGTGATIMMPGEPAPTLRRSGTRGGTTSQQSSSGSGGQSGSSTAHGNAPDPDGELTLLGGSAGEHDTEVRERDAPLGPLAALLGYPFWLFGKSVEQEADEAVDQREVEPATPELQPRASVADDAERMRVQAENDRLRANLGRVAAEPRSSSIRAELAALERTLSGSPSSSDPGTRVAREAIDRNADGRADLWQYREEGRGAREVIDADHDGRADRILYYDAARRLLRTEEDTNGDGSLDTVSSFVDGELARKRQDTNGDGEPDAWTVFHAGQTVRHEVDRSGDGFRDLVMIYSDGDLVREEEDTNGDGRPDRLTHYRDGQRIEEHVDVDHDGRPDVASFYENGRLVRREASSEAMLEEWSSGASDRSRPREPRS